MQTDLRAWTIKDSIELYNVNGWGRDFFSINEAGNIEVTPGGPGSARIDLKELVDDLRSRGLQAAAPDPLLRHPAHAHRSSCAASFQQAIAENEYKGSYRGVYPIKVNQQRHVVEELIEYGRPYNLGHRGRLQARAAGRAGAAGQSRRADPLQRLQGPRATSRPRCWPRSSAARSSSSWTAWASSRRILAAARELDIRPIIGVRARLSTKGAGKWVESAGDRSKFGLTTAEIVEAVERLRGDGMLDCLQLLHFHIGSQITTIRADQGRAARGEPHLRRAARARRQHALPRLRRRPRRRLRRQPDQLPLVGELHARRSTPPTSSARSPRRATRRACRIPTS